MPPKVGELPDAAGLREALRKILRRICPRGLEPMHEDLVQIAVLKVLETKGSEQDHGRPASYLWRVAHSAMVDELRRLKRRPVVSVEEVAELDPPAPSSRPQLGMAIRQCLQLLLEARREAVGLHLFGYRAEEVAALLGWPSKRVQNSTYRGLADLRRCLEEKGFAP